MSRESRDGVSPRSSSLRIAKLWVAGAATKSEDLQIAQALIDSERELVALNAPRSENAPATESARWNLVRRWLTNQEQIYIPGINQARTVEAVNEAVDAAIRSAERDGGQA